jgi:deoxyribonuclease-4
MKQKNDPLEVVSHVPFIVNMASGDDALLSRSRHRVVQEIAAAKMLGITRIVLHPGSCQNASKEIGLSKLIASLDDVFEHVGKTNVKIDLETMAGQGTMLCSNFNEIKHVLDNIEHPGNVGVCFDTAHVFIAGYNFDGYDGYASIMNSFDDIIGISKIDVIHLNDAATDLGSHNDRHACIGEGKMGIRVFHALLKDDRFHDIPKILEIPERDAKSEKCLKYLRKIQDLDEIAESRKIMRMF